MGKRGLALDHACLLIISNQWCRFPSHDQGVLDEVFLREAVEDERCACQRFRPAVTAARVPVALPLALADCSSRGCASADSASV